MQIQLTERPSVVRPSPEPGSADDPGSKLILGRYRLAARLAVGGTAEVWRATDELLDRPVAVKLLHEHLLADRRARDRLAAEARAVGVLAHRSITRIYDLDLESERPALVLELVEGHSLARRLDDGPLPPRRAATIAAEVADALAHAHERGVVHRDVKPGNILIDLWGRAHLVDFGIAQGLVGGAEHLTSTGTIAGTLPYMAPEQLADEPIGPWTDLYALGAVLYQALTGRLPFESVAPLALARQQAAGPPALRGVAPALTAVVRACLARRVADRPRSAATVARALRAWLMGDSRPALAMAPFPMGSLVRLAGGFRGWTEAWRHGRPVVAAIAASAAAGILALSFATGGAAPAAAPALGPLQVEGAVIPARVIVGNAGGAVVVTPGTADTAGAPVTAVTADAADAADGADGADGAASADSPWIAGMVAEYRRGCGSGADPLDLAGRTREDAAHLVSSRMGACAAPTAPAGPRADAAGRKGPGEAAKDRNDDGSSRHGRDDRPRGTGHGGQDRLGTRGELPSGQS